MMILSLIGPPCVGKGTQSRILQQERSFKVIGAGDLLRKAASTDESCAQMVKDGQLVPVEYIWKLMKIELNKELKLDQNANILLDGYHRELGQAKCLDKYMEDKDYKLCLINMYADEGLLVERMKKRVFCAICGNTDKKVGKVCCGQSMERRDDDNEVSFCERLKIFNNNIDIVRKFYKNNDRYIWCDMNANGSVDKMNENFNCIIDQAIKMQSSKVMDNS